MRTKSFLAAAAIIAVGALAAQAQSNVYSLNVVGYVNVAYKAGFNAAANPLVGNPDNTLNSIMKGAGVPDNTIIFQWNTTLQDFDPVLPTYVAGSGTRTPNVAVNQGQGVFVFAPTDFTNTFVGEVKQGTTTTSIAPGFNGIASPAPIGGDVPTVLAGIVATDNDLAFKWDTTVQDFGLISTYVAASGTWTPTVNFAVGEGLMYFSSAANTVNWVRNFTVAP